MNKTIIRSNTIRKLKHGDINDEDGVGWVESSYSLYWRKIVPRFYNDYHQINQVNILLQNPTAENSSLNFISLLADKGIWRILSKVCISHKFWVFLACTNDIQLSWFTRKLPFAQYIHSLSLRTYLLHHNTEIII